MQARKRCGGVSVLLLLAATGARGEAPGNPDRGLAYARAHCAICHAVEGSQQAPGLLPAASFTQIADTPGMTALALAVWFQTPHREMPNFVIAPADRDDLIAYITSLRSR